MAVTGVERLVTMANQIAKAFRAEGPARAVPQIRDHVDKFWDPRMKAIIAAHVAAGGAGLEPEALAALTPEVGLGTPEAPSLVTPGTTAPVDAPTSRPVAVVGGDERKAG